MRRVLLTIAVTAAAALSLVFTSEGAANAANPVPAAKALVNHPFVKSFTAKELAAWPQSNLGNCVSNPKEVFLDPAGYAEVNTTGITADCADIVSPHAYPTVDGYVYEMRVWISNVTQWNSYWMTGNNWPTDGEIDSTEGLGGTNCATYHGAGNTTTGSCSFTNTPVPTRSPNLVTPGWNTVDIAFGGCGSGCGRIEIFYNGRPYVNLASPLVLDGGRQNDPFWISYDARSCDSVANTNTCGSVKTPDPGVNKIAYLRIFK